MESNEMSIHKAAFFWDDKKGKNVVTVCGVANYNQAIAKVQNWDDVTCKRCLLDKKAFEISSVNLK
jgi:hypothetical protein